jgi:hypothetical protein
MLTELQPFRLPGPFGAVTVTPYRGLLVMTPGEAGAEEH